MTSGQAALEQLLVMGFSFLVIIAGIAALGYFGILEMDRVTPEICRGPTGLECVSGAVIGSGVVDGEEYENVLVFPVVNNRKADIEVSYIGPVSGDCGAGNAIETATVQISGSGENALNQPDNNGKVSATKIKDERTFVIRLVCPSSFPQKIKTEIVVNYKNLESGLEHSDTFFIKGKINTITS